MLSPSKRTAAYTEHEDVGASTNTISVSSDPFESDLCKAREENWPWKRAPRKAELRTGLQESTPLPQEPGPERLLPQPIASPLLFRVGLNHKIGRRLRNAWRQSLPAKWLRRRDRRRYHSASTVESEITPESTASHAAHGRSSYLARLGVKASASAGHTTRVSFAQAAESRLGSDDDWEDVAEDMAFQLLSNEVSSESCLSDKGSGSGKDIRLRLLQKLSYERAWVPRAMRERRSQTTIILDWDDTLLCTAYLQRYAGQVDASLQRSLQRLSNTALKVIEQAQSLGDTCIITNARKGWVEQSAEKYSPALASVMKSMRIISARDRYEEQYPQQRDWKVQAFLALRRQMREDAVKNVVSIGDSVFELDAAHCIGRTSDRIVVKTIKLQEDPSPLQLQKQLLEVLRRLPSVVESGRSIDATLCWRPAAQQLPAKEGLP